MLLFYVIQPCLYAQLSALTISIPFQFIRLSTKELSQQISVQESTLSGALRGLFPFRPFLGTFLFISETLFKSVKCICF